MRSNFCYCDDAVGQCVCVDFISIVVNMYTTMGYFDKI